MKSKPTKDVSTTAAMPSAIERWKDLRFGLFVHWGPVSLAGTEIGWSRGSQVPTEEYDQLHSRFNPVHFDASAWAATAKAAGMRYLVLTTKHHDGFCLWDTKQTDYKITKTPFQRDVVRELSEACRKAGLGFGAYYSTCDWHHPDFPLTGPSGSVVRKKSNLDRYTDYLKAQVRELLENYGPLTTLWFDVPQRFHANRGQEVIRMARSIQPDILINDRTGARGDYATPEQRVGGFDIHRPWETCMTIGQQWAWKQKEKNKSLRECLHTLIRTAGGDGNLLFNVGPDPLGRIERRQLGRLADIGAWLDLYGESIHGTRGGPYAPDESFACTHKGNCIYLHLLKTPGTVFKLPFLPARVLGARLLTGGKATVQQDDSGLLVTISRNDPARLDTLVRLDLDQPAEDLHIHQPMDAIAIQWE